MAGEAFRRKTRTRQHVIADLGVNYTARQILLAGYTADRIAHDYGLDLSMKTFNAAGEIEAGTVEFQVKATDHFATHADGVTFPLRVSVSDMKSWVFEWTPVILILYDAIRERAYWLDVQDYARAEEIAEDPNGETVTLRIPVKNVFDPSAVKWLRDRKEQTDEGGPQYPGPARSS